MLRLFRDDRLLVRSGYSLAAILLLASCDPAFTYRPQGWQTEKGQDFEWSTSFRGIDLTTWGIDGLLGDRFISPEFDVHNSTDKALVLEGAELVAEAGHYSGEVPDGAIEWRTVEPHSTRRIPIGWNFDQRPIDLLGANPSLVLTFRLGDEPVHLEITYERVD